MGMSFEKLNVGHICKELVCKDGLLLDYLLDLRNPYPPTVMGKKRKSNNKPQNYRLSIGFQK
jgi:hypothetical protein